MADDEGELIETGEPPFFLIGRTIYKRGREWKMPNGTRSKEMNFPVCEVHEFFKDPKPVLDLLNAGAAAEKASA
jgi:hypothetical protein